MTSQLSSKMTSRSERTLRSRSALSHTSKPSQKNTKSEPKTSQRNNNVTPIRATNQLPLKCKRNIMRNKAAEKLAALSDSTQNDSFSSCSALNDSIDSCSAQNDSIDSCSAQNDSNLPADDTNSQTENYGISSPPEENTSLIETEDESSFSDTSLPPLDSLCRFDESESLTNEPESSGLQSIQLNM